MARPSYDSSAEHMAGTTGVSPANDTLCQHQSAMKDTNLCQIEGHLSTMYIDEADALSNPDDEAPSAAAVYDERFSKEVNGYIMKRKAAALANPFFHRPYFPSTREAADAARSWRSKLQPSPGLFFLYGTLMDPILLASLLDLSEIPELRPAYTVGRHIEIWGSVAALLDQPQGFVTEGAVYKVESMEHAVKLHEYYTSAYSPSHIEIWYLDRTEKTACIATAYKYEDDPKELTPKAFDLKAHLRDNGRLQSLKEIEKIEARRVKLAPEFVLCDIHKTRGLE